MTYCPCCANQLLHHVRGTAQYWFCRTCWQEMPMLSLEASFRATRLNAQWNEQHNSFASKLSVGRSSVN